LLETQQHRKGDATATPMAILATPIRETVAENDPASLWRIRLAMNEGNCKRNLFFKLVVDKNRKKP